VPAGTPIAVSVLLLHHRADLYPDPFAFRPERWLGRKPGAYEWIPFGGGTRRLPRRDAHDRRATNRALSDGRRSTSSPPSQRPNASGTAT
jgi:hypothetical protein